ncbi:pyrimidine-nucleoside phosphorylase [Yeguia hominis]|uniref:Pyrimidine-nucleoside phosphorylase n=1 Tax=Yeguia hominis TaxID=2763662 RepID=A0A926D8G6_9FIRM|nr:pyrimidine-nucleoside phosphorylase [Yeguia hominis]MBC8533302.1 pyrimidine-nucleoside phosphorylase [Yeguia hominis]
MRMYEILAKKREGEELTKEEIQFFISGVTDGSIPDYQITALLMAICIRGMTRRETSALTMAMEHSGDTVDLSSLPGIKVDKHSTGGVGDKTTLIAAPIAAALGVTVAKMSGRGLGHTGGTVDKMESIPGLRTALSREEFFDVVRKTGLSVVGQSGNLDPADKKLYALRDVTATVESIPLIASSIMSKKLAAGADKILLDVKTGSGAFMKTQQDAEMLAREMVEIGRSVGRETIALVTDMDVPLGNAIGNTLEILEVCQTLRGHGPQDLTVLCLELASNMALLAGAGDTIESCRAAARKALESGAALQKLCDMVSAQGGDASYLQHPETFSRAPVKHELFSDRDGYITHMNAEACGEAAMILGAGRIKKEDLIDHSAGIWLLRKTGDAVRAGEVLAVMETAEERFVAEAEPLLRSAYQIGSQQPERRPLILKRIAKSE